MFFAIHIFEIDIFLAAKKTLLTFMDYFSKQRASISRRLKQLTRYDEDFGSAVSESAYSQSLIDTYEGEGFDSEQELRELAKTVDTALLRIYVELDHPLLGSLFRVRNQCDPVYVEKLLSRREKWIELSEFYRGKRLHEKALLLLQR